MPRQTTVDWSQVDWSLTNAEIGRLIGKSRSTVHERRDLLGLPQRRRGDPHRQPKKQYLCRWCGVSFSRAQRNGPHRGFCSPAHGWLSFEAARKKLWREKDFAAEMARLSPVCRPDENNKAASEWSLVSPAGDVHAFRNLAHFVREHPDLFEPADLIRKSSTTTNAALGLAALRPRADGTAARESWKGWTWRR